MPRTTRAQGRPGTKVIPDIWESSHAVVVGKTRTAEITIFGRNTDDAEPVMNADFTYDAGNPAATLYTGPARIQSLGSALDSQVLAADQAVATSGYLIVIDRDADNIPVGSIVQVTASTDPTLTTDRRLVVRKIARGSLRWERDLWCTDDLTSPATN